MAHREQYELHLEGDTAVFQISEASAFGDDELRDAIRKDLASPEFAGARNAVADCGKLKYGNSMFLESMIEIGRSVKKRQGVFALCCVGEFLRQIVELSHLHQLWPICDTREQALALIREKTDPTDSP